MTTETLEKLAALRTEYERNPGNETALTRYSVELIKTGRVGEARQILDHGLKLFPKSLEVLWQCAVANLYSQRIEQALPFLYEMLRLEPGHTEAREKIRSLHARLVGSWHYGMINDSVRGTRNSVTFKAHSDGACHGIAQWFRLFTDRESYVDTSPEEDNFHWMQVV